jgi:squalene synthase HpnC
MLLATNLADLIEARAHCRRLAASHYENFSVATWLLPRYLRQHFANVYAYCRTADDLADEQASQSDSLALLDDWEAQLDAAYEGQATHPVFIALRDTIREYQLPKQPFADLLVAFRRDQRQTRYETLPELLTYCEKSANPVGRIILGIGCSTNDENVRLSDSVCTGLQLANFWQDVARDYARGRIYIPLEFCRSAGWDECRFAPGTCDDDFRRMLTPLVANADERLVAGYALVPRVRRELRLPVKLFIEGGRAVLAAIRARQYDVWSRRPKISRFQKLRILAAALVSTGLSR